LFLQPYLGETKNSTYTILQLHPSQNNKLIHFICQQSKGRFRANSCIIKDNKKVPDLPAEIIPAAQHPNQRRKMFFKKSQVDTKVDTVCVRSTAAGCH